MFYILLLIFLFIIELLYFKIASKYNIIDKPNERSSHSSVTLRGGGVIFWFASLLYFIFNYSPQTIWFFAGITLISAVSLIDDIVTLGQKTRLLVHLFAVSCAFIFIDVFAILPLLVIPIVYIVFIGIINVYNFMDGINGITGLYSIAVLLSLQYVNFYISPFISPDLIWYPILASLVFLFFNFRKQAKCFAGDVGSISIAFWIVSLLLILMIETNNLVWIGFLMIYGVDSVCTIIHRIYLGENIMEAHRLHFYQILVNERKSSQRLVSVIYFISQLLVSSLIIWLFPTWGWRVLIAPIIILTFLYMLKFRLMTPKKCQIQN